MSEFPINAGGTVSFSLTAPIATDAVLNGVLVGAGPVVRAATSGGTNTQNGLRTTNLGQLLVVDSTAGLPAGTIVAGGLPFANTGALCVSNAAVSVVLNGIPFAANGGVAGSIA